MLTRILSFDPYTDHYIGYEQAAIELVEYGDFLCPYSALAYPEIKYLQDVLGNQFRFIYRNTISGNVHPLAFVAATAAEAAARQGKFWYMHDMIFENQVFLTASSFMKFAKEIELDFPLFENDIRDPELIRQCKSEQKKASLLGLNKTPSFFINGAPYKDYPDFEGLLNACFHLLDHKTTTYSSVASSCDDARKKYIGVSHFPSKENNPASA